MNEKNQLPESKPQFQLPLLSYSGIHYPGFNTPFGYNILHLLADFLLQKLANLLVLPLEKLMHKSELEKCLRTDSEVWPVVFWNLNAQANNY